MVLPELRVHPQRERSSRGLPSLQTPTILLRTPHTQLLSKNILFFLQELSRASRFILARTRKGHVISYLVGAAVEFLIVTRTITNLPRQQGHPLILQSLKLMLAYGLPLFLGARDYPTIISNILNGNYIHFLMHFYDP